MTVRLTGDWRRARRMLMGSARKLRRGMEAAVREEAKRARTEVISGIRKQAPGGKLDFQALRTAFVNLVFEYGQVSPKEAQDLARHSTPDLTFNVYGRSREGRLVEAVERLADAVLPVKRVPGEYRLAVGAERENATPFELKELRSLQSVSGGRARTPITAFWQF